MGKSHLCLLAVAIVIASIIIAGCATSNQANQGSETSTNASTSATTTSAASTATTTSSIVTPSPSASPTATPSSAGKVVTSIQLGGSSQGPPQLVFAREDQINWDIEVTSSKQPMVCGAVTVLIDGKSVGQVTSGGSSDCFKTAYFTADTSSLSTTSDNKHSVTIHYAGDNTYQPSTYEFKITVT
jgi:hypothetical protein